MVKRIFRNRKMNVSWLESRFYRKSLLIIVLVTCFPTIIVGIGIHIMGTRQIEKSVMNSYHTEVMLSSRRIDDF